MSLANLGFLPRLKLATGSTRQPPTSFEFVSDGVRSCGAEHTQTRRGFFSVKASNGRVGVRRKKRKQTHRRGEDIEAFIMGEDRATFADKKNGGDSTPSRQRHSSIISSCSEDVESETTSTGYPPTPDEERDEELEYGPGIVNKLRTKFLTISLKQNRGASIRRSCSMENLLDPPPRNNMFSPSDSTSNDTGKDPEEQKSILWGNLKRAKSMDTLLMDLHQESSSPVSLQPETRKEPKIVRRREGVLSRTVPTICDEELPKPDTVKTYKRMFEPAESRRGSYSRRPPVLRASAKSGGLCVSKINGVSSSSAKVNGTAARSKLSAKQFPLKKAQPESEVIPSNNSNSSLKQQPLVNGEDSKPLCNGSYVKATPVKITDNSLCNGKIEKTVEKDANELSKKEVLNNQKNGIICNGNSPLKELIKSEKNEDFTKPDVKKLVHQTYKVLNGNDNQVANVLNGLKTKPKVPPNRPTFVKNVKHSPKITELNGIDKKSPLIPKLKPTTIAVLKKSQVAAKPAVSSKPEEVASSEPRLNTIVNGEAKIKEAIPPKTAVEPKKIVVEPKKIVVENNKRNVEKIEPETKVVDKTNPIPKKEPEKDTADYANGNATDSEKITNSHHQPEQLLELKSESKCVKKQQQSSSEHITTSMVFDFRGKDVVPHVAVLPVPFGCKALHPKKKAILIDGKDSCNGNSADSDDEDEYHMDYSVPPPSGVTFEGENVKIGKGSILLTRNKDVSNFYICIFF